MRPRLDRIQKGEIDPTFIVTHRVPLADAPRGYDIFTKKEDACVKIVVDPWA